MLKKYRSLELQVLISVFLTGACALVIEVTGMRMLAPYFGSTIFTTTSVISVFLAALSLGYYYGGKLSDKHPGLPLFYTLIMLGGISMLILQLLRYLVLPVVGDTLSIQEGPLLASVVLFLLPGFLLGCISPFALKLLTQASKTPNIGTISGKVSFFSTLGSIAGSICTGFFLLPSFTIDSVVFGTAILLIVLGALPLFLGVPELTKMKHAIKLVTGLVVLFSVSWTASRFEHNPALLFQKEGVYQLISVFTTQEHDQEAHVLFLDTNKSGAAYTHSSELVFEYTQYYRLYSLFVPQLKKALFIGGGSYTLPYKLVTTHPTVEVDVVEIEPGLEELSHTYFGVAPHPRMHTHLTDGRRFLMNSATTYDYIFSDAYLSLLSVPAHMTTKEFFALTKERLSDQGIFIANIVGSLPTKTTRPSFLASEIKTFQSVFPDNFIIAVDSAQSTAVQNFIFVGFKQPRELHFTSPQILTHTDERIRTLQDHLVTLPPQFTKDAAILTDAYAPVDYLTAQSL